VAFCCLHAVDGGICRFVTTKHEKVTDFCGFFCLKLGFWDGERRCVMREEIEIVAPNWADGLTLQHKNEVVGAL
jgi:hypothetical protein